MPEVFSGAGMSPPTTSLSGRTYDPRPSKPTLNTRCSNCHSSVTLPSPRRWQTRLLGTLTVRECGWMSVVETLPFFVRTPLSLPGVDCPRLIPSAAILQELDHLGRF